MKECNAKPSRISVDLVNFSMLLYAVWLMLPAVQTTGRAVTGALATALFALGVVLDTAFVKKNLLWLAGAAACALGMPLVLRVFAGRGGANFGGYYVQQVMFWLPMVFAAYAYARGDRRHIRALKWTLIGVMAVTTLTTIGWLIQGMLRGGRVYAYSRSLGYAGNEPGQAAYLKELMLRNIGGYDFIYASVAALPLWCLAIQKNRGRARTGYAALLCVQTVMIVLSQYTYAMLYAAAILFVEGVALIVRAAGHGRAGTGRSLLWGAAALALLAVLAVPLVQLAAQVCAGVGLTNFAYSFEQLAAALGGAATAEDSRLSYYLLALRGIARSPFVGTLFGGERMLSMHSDVLDLLSGVGVVGTAAVGALLWWVSRGLWQALRRSEARAQLIVMLIAVGVTAALGTVVYSRDIPLVVFSALLLTNFKEI